MKHILLLILATIMPIFLMGQQKFIEKAMQNRIIGHWGTVSDVPQINFMTKEYITKYCDRFGYLCRNIKTIEIPSNKWDEVWFKVESFEILPKDELDIYIYNEKMSGSYKVSFSYLTSTGKGMWFNYYKGITIDNFKWSGEVKNGLINGNGTGFTKKDDIYYFIQGEFINGFPKDGVLFEEYNYDSETHDNYYIDFGEPSENMACVKRSNDINFGFVTTDGKYVNTDAYEEVIEPFHNGHAIVKKRIGTTDKETTCPTCSGRGVVKGCSTCGGDGYTGWSNDTKCSTCNGTGAHRCSQCSGKGRYKSSSTPIYKEWVIDKNCNFVDVSDHQKAMDEEERLAKENAEKARQQRIKDSLDRIEQLRIEAERKKAELERKVAINCNSKLWHQGDHICYSLPNYSGKITCGTLEEWNQGHTKAKIKVVTSPSNTATYNGELLQKNNTFWIDAKGTKWHLALEGEFEESLKYDNSIKGPDVIYQQAPSSSPHRYDDCDDCKGSGKVECYNCGGDGYSGWNNDEFCTRCNGRGMLNCSRCRGTGRK